MRNPATKKRSVYINGYKTSVTVEQQFWDDLGSIAGRLKCSRNKLVAEIDANRGGGNLSSSIRLYVLANVRGMNEQRAA